MSVILSEVKYELIKDIAKCEGFDDYTIEVTTGTVKGDGYLGIIYTICIQDKHKSNNQLHLTVKSALTEEKLREGSPIKEAYDREIYLYKVVFPEFDLLSQELGITNKFCETAKCYGSLSMDKEECIVLENLKEIDFKLWDRKLPMTEEHVALVFKTYAKFHGTGLALKFLKPEKFGELCENLKNIILKDEEREDDRKKFEEGVKFIFAIAFKAVADNKNATQGLIKFAQICTKFFFEDVKKVDKYSTILHDDCWCNNIMFKYDDLENSLKPTEVRLLDWQISHIGSPIMDLSYFFYACVSDTVLYKLKYFLKIYHQNLYKIIEEAGLNPDLLTYEELQKQWKIYSKYGFIRALLIMKLILSEVEEAPDLSELAKSGKNIVESVSCTESTNLEAINKRIADIIVFMNEHDYL